MNRLKCPFNQFILPQKWLPPGKVCRQRYPVGGQIYQVSHGKCIFVAENVRSATKDLKSATEDVKSVTEDTRSVIKDISSMTKDARPVMEDVFSWPKIPGQWPKKLSQ